MKIDFEKIDQKNFKNGWQALKLGDEKYVLVNSQGAFFSADRKKNKLNKFFRSAEVFDNQMMVGYLPNRYIFSRVREDLFINEEGTICVYQNGKLIGNNFRELVDTEGNCIGYTNGKETFKFVFVTDKINLVSTKHLETIDETTEKYKKVPTINYYLNSETRKCDDFSFINEEKLNDNYRVIDLSSSEKCIYSIKDRKLLPFRFKSYLYVGKNLVAINMQGNYQFVLYNLNTRDFSQFNFKYCEEIDDKHLMIVKEEDGKEKYYIANNDFKILSSLNSKIEYVRTVKVIDTDSRYANTDFIREKYSVVKNNEGEEFFLVEGNLEKRLSIGKGEGFTQKYWDIDRGAVYIPYQLVDGKKVEGEEFVSKNQPNIVDYIECYKPNENPILGNNKTEKTIDTESIISSQKTIDEKTANDVYNYLENEEKKKFFERRFERRVVEFLNHQEYLNKDKDKDL